MKMASRLCAAIVISFAVTAPSAFARSRHRSHASDEDSRAEPSDVQVMTITDAWYPDLLVAPPVTRPSGSSYNTPKSPALSVELTPPPSSAATNADAAHPETAAHASVEHNAPSPTEIVTAAIKGTKIDGIAISTPLNGVHTAAAAPPSNAKTSRTPGSLLFDETHDDSPLDPTNWAVNIYKRQQCLLVYFKGRLFKRYDAVFGRNLDGGAKQWAQDRRTPEGVYAIIEKYPSVRFRWFLRLNYPNLADRVRYETMKVNGVVPVDADGNSPTVGSAIGIHGTDVPILNSGHINWTTGCISLMNGDIDDLDRLLPVGTVVIIKP